MYSGSGNRVLKGRQGTPTGRTLPMSPVMVTAAALAREGVDVREFFEMRETAGV